MCTYNAISSHTDHFEIQKGDSEESLLTFVNLFPSEKNHRCDFRCFFVVVIVLLVFFSVCGIFVRQT